MWQRGVECDGKCYTDEGICPRAEWCDKTRKGEFAATALAGFFFLVVLVMLAPGMIALKLLDWVFTGENVPVNVAARVMKKDPQFVRQGIIQGLLTFGVAFKKDGSSQYDYYISPMKFWQETGYVYDGIEV